MRISTDEERQPNSLEAKRIRFDAFVPSRPGWQIEPGHRGPRRCARTYALRFRESKRKRVKGVPQTPIDGIRVDARDQIKPTSRVSAVRI